MFLRWPLRSKVLVQCLIRRGVAPIGDPWKSGVFAETAVSESAGFGQLLNSPEKYFSGILKRRRKPLAHNQLLRLEAGQEPTAAWVRQKNF